VDANRITKGTCGREAGFIPANGLVYVGPKHCACWPMLQGYAALAPEAASAKPPAGEPTAPHLDKGPAYSDARNPEPHTRNPIEWPSYRADCWRSASTTSSVPAELEVLWTAKLGGWPQGHLVQDWKEDLFVPGPVTAPVVARGTAFVARPDAHQVVALDAQTGQARWDFTANGRVDGPPTICGGLCLFGTRSGWVYCLDAADGRLVWRLRAAPNEERIISFGQLESPWPVPGSVLVAGDTAYFAAGRHPLADGGIRVFAIEPASGRVKWAKRLATLPMTQFYAGAGLEFDPIDLLVAESKRPEAARERTEGPDFVTLSRWRFAPGTGEMADAWRSGFAFAGTVPAPRGAWTYGPRMDYIPSGPKPGKPDYVRTSRRPLVAFRGGTLVGSSDDRLRLFRSDFSPEQAAKFNDVWFTQTTLPRGKDQKGDRSRNERLAHDAKWTAPAFESAQGGQGVAALVLAGDAAFVAGSQGGLVVLAMADGKKLAERGLPSPIWDGMAAAYGRLYVSTQDGDLVCLGKN